MSLFNSPCPHADGKECEHCRIITAQDGWTFRGCFCHPNKGKFIAEVKECPKKKKEDKK